MKLKAITAASVSLQAGPPILPGRTVDFGEAINPKLLTEIEENVKKGFLAIVAEPPASLPDKGAARK